MERYEGTTMIKTFRGLLAEGGQDTITLHTNTGSMGYRIVKFEVLGPNANTSFEQVLKIYKVEQATVDADIDFSDQTLLAAAVANDSVAEEYLGKSWIVFDQEIFNQDIYITNKGANATSAMNYYIELEQVKLDLNQNTVATLKDIRNITAP
jgi:hypothetical protein